MTSKSTSVEKLTYTLIAPFVPVPSVSLGATPLEVRYAALVPGMVGVYQINVAVPYFIKSGEQVTLQIQQDTFKVRVVNP